MMPIGNGAACHDATCLDSNALLELLIRAYGSPTVDSYHGNGPASYLQFPGFTGKIGWIGALHQPFCAACNRIRITSDGKLKTCLYYSSQLALRPLMQQGVSLIEPIRNAILQKPQAHHFSFAQKTDETNGMMQIGG
jgi:cyclic pyranopterin phosphate synthase